MTCGWRASEWQAMVENSESTSKPVDKAAYLGRWFLLLVAPTPASTRLFPNHTTIDS